ncbi:hypothetical protein BD769DRAFT_1457264 [Suillus cothurnatus]|nr:hypothetical protein BD769DRAFT_1457264 [Suillus cothurnatus]
MLGQKIYEQFTTVVHLKEQIRVTNPEWNDLLHHIQHGSCHGHHVQLLRSLVLTNPHCPPTDFNSPPRNDAVLITPYNAVHRQSGNQLFVCKAKDTIQGQELTLMERYAVATNPNGRNAKQDEQAALPNVVTQKQLPLTPAYAFTDYQSQGQTVSNAIIDIAMPPSGGLSPFNVYVALSRGHGQENIQLLRDFDKKLLTTHPSEYLHIEDQRIMKLDQITEQWWDSKKQEAIIDCGNIHAIQSQTNMKDVEML